MYSCLPYSKPVAASFVDLATKLQALPPSRRIIISLPSEFGSVRQSIFGPLAKLAIKPHTSNLLPRVTVAGCLLPTCKRRHHGGGPLNWTFRCGCDAFTTLSENLTCPPMNPAQVIPCLTDRPRACSHNPNVNHNQYRVLCRV